VAGIAGAIGATLTVVSWRLFARQLVPVAEGVPSVAHCTRKADPRYAEAIDHARDQITSMVREKRIPGMSVTVAINGGLVWSEGFGYADVDGRVPACPDTRFRVGSVTKPITAAAMAKLHEEGKLDLDAPVQRYVPSFPHAVTARQLAGHRAGIRHYRDDMEAFTRQHYASLTHALSLFQNDSLLFPPGSNHEYTSYGYLLLGAAIEAASGQEFGAYLTDHVFRPLGMSRSTVDRNDSTLAGLTRLYDHVTPYVTDGQVHPAPFVDMSSKLPGGGVISTTEDLARFGSAFLPGARAPFVDERTRRMLFKPLTRAPVPIFGFGLGWMTMREIDARRTYMHFGAASGTTAFLALFPDQRVVVALLANLGHAGFPYASTIGLASHFMGPPVGAAVLIWLATFVVFAGAAYVLTVLYRRLVARP
jgi:serine beta-lactamase-like protein LACTB, mitochondrial